MTKADRYYRAIGIIVWAFVLCAVAGIATGQTPKEPRVDGMVNCTITEVGDVVTLQCAKDDNLMLDIPRDEWPDSWERVFKPGWNFAAMHERGSIRPVKTPPKHVNGPCERPHHKEGEGNIRPSNCIVTP